LLNSDDEDEQLDSLDDVSCEEIDTNMDYREILAKIMAQIYSKREKMSLGKASLVATHEQPTNHTSTIMLLMMSKLR